MTNRSVTVLVENASEVAQRLGGFINGISFYHITRRQDVVVVTVRNCPQTLKTTPAFRALKREGKLVSWARA